MKPKDLSLIQLGIGFIFVSYSDIRFFSENPNIRIHFFNLNMKQIFCMLK